MPVVTKNELDLSLSLLPPNINRLSWFTRQPENFQQEVASAIKFQSIKSAKTKVRDRYLGSIAENRLKRLESATNGQNLLSQGTVIGILGKQGLLLETEYGSLSIRSPRSDAKFLVLFVKDDLVKDDLVKDDSLVSYSLTSSKIGIRQCCNTKRNEFKKILPIVYDLIVEYDYEGACALSAL